LIEKEKRQLYVQESLDTTGIGRDLSTLKLKINPFAGGVLKCLRNNIPILLSGATKGENEILNAIGVKKWG